MDIYLIYLVRLDLGLAKGTPHRGFGTQSVGMSGCYVDGVGAAAISDQFGVYPGPSTKRPSQFLWNDASLSTPAAQGR